MMQLLGGDVQDYGLDDNVNLFGIGQLFNGLLSLAHNP